MKVKAIATLGSDLSRKSLEAFHHPEEEFQLNVGDIYIVYGINIWQGIIHYLTFDKWYNNPFWTPAELFEIIDNRLPSNWYFKFYGYEDNVSINAVWGYKELALLPEHYDQLIEREGDAIPIFNERRIEIDQFHNSTERTQE
jgi:hypothetical protein